MSQEGGAAPRGRQDDVWSAGRAQDTMEPASLLDGKRAEGDASAAAERDASDGSRREGSDGRFSVTWDELRVALWCSVVCAVTALLIAVPAGAAEFLLDGLSYMTFGEGVDQGAPLRNVTHMHSRKAFVIEYDLNSTTARVQLLWTKASEQTVVLLFLPSCYVAYLGASYRAFCWMIGSAALAYMISFMGYVFLGGSLILYYPVLGFGTLIVALKRVSPHNSRLPAQAIKQALVGIVGNVLLMNVLEERNVRLNIARFALQGC